MPPLSWDASLTDLAINLVLAAAMSAVLGLVYVRCGASFSNRKAFARNFYLLSMTIALIITIVKSSLALSLGLVGALSIVRYRAAIKEPEELAYLFVTIAIGLGLGANYRAITITAFVVIVGVIILHHTIARRSTLEDHMNYNLSVLVAKRDGRECSIESVVKLLAPHCSQVRIKRFEDTKDHLDISFLIEYRNSAALDNMTRDLQALHESTRVFFLDSPYD